MITEDYVSFEVAKLLKDKGFNDPFTHMFINKDNVKFDCSSSGVVPKETIACPTHQMAMKWLREVHGIFIAINNDDLDFNWQCYDLINRDDALDPEMLSESYAGYKTYEEAVEAALKYSLENLVLL